MNTNRTLAVITMSLMLGACGGRSNTLPDTEPVDDIPPGTAGTTASGVGSAGSRAGSAIPDDRLDDATAAYLDDLIVYFEFDRSEVQPRFTDLLAAHARNLANNPRLRVRLEGHADERGSREYNIGLGERRAQAVRRILLIQGASAGQINTVSYGEERPAERGSSESAYAQNRRVEIVYQN
ncbi:MAG: peptidoglycan-associated lipoprotein Pal [Gammaproteobacteria bacterium]